jgi:hypothetical protein
MGPLSQSLLVALSAAALVHAGENPAFPFPEDTTPLCSWWTDYYGSKSCAQLLQDEMITLEEFILWVRDRTPELRSVPSFVHLTLTEPVNFRPRMRGAHGSHVILR